MSEETYEISPDETGEDIVVQRVICTKCGHYEFMTPAEASKVDDSFKCTLCTLPDGVKRVVKGYIQCGACGEVYDAKDPKCFCVEKPKPLLTYSHSSKELRNPVTKRAEEWVEEGQLRGEEQRIVRNAKREAVERQIRDSDNLAKLVELLSKKEVKNPV